MRCKLAFTYEGYSSQATGLVKECGAAEEAEPARRMVLHWISARDYANHNDYKRASAEAKAAIAMAPYDTLSHADLSWIVTEAGDYETAIAWATFATTHDPHPKGWYFDNLINAYQMADRWPDALKLAEEQTSRTIAEQILVQSAGAPAYFETGQRDKATKARKTFETLPYLPE